MTPSLILAPLLLLFFALPAVADQVGTASGKGVIQRFIPNDPEGDTEDVPFSPSFSFAQTEGSGDKQTTWIILADKQPPITMLMSAADKSEARRLWCEKEKASWVALKLDAKFAIDLYLLCPGNGSVNTEMLSTINGLDSVVVTFEAKSDTRLKGKVRGGEGSCPKSDTENAYCTQKSDFTFDAPILR